MTAVFYGFPVLAYIPHGHCYFWPADLVTLHVISDSLTALAYYSIPIILITFVRKGYDLPSLSWIFGLFTTGCGTTHVLDIYTLWVPTYWLSGSVKLLTAFGSMWIALALIPIFPKLLALPSSVPFKTSNQELQAEIRKRQPMETDRNYQASFTERPVTMATQSKTQIEKTQTEKTQIEQQVLERTLKLRQSQERFNLAVRGSGDGLWDWDLLTNQVYFTPRFEEILGYQEYELNLNFDSFRGLIHPDDIEFFSTGFQNHLQCRDPFDVDVRLCAAEAAYVWVNVRGQAIWNRSDIAVRMAGSIRNITARKQVEAQLQTALAEKKILLKEIHHRVKNNLQIVSGLLYLQARRVTEPTVVKSLQESQNRILSMALIHEQLYSTGNLKEINAQIYLRNLTQILISMYNNTQITLDLAIDSLHLGLDLAIPCGLIVCELISNAFKYAFPNQAEGEITIRLSQLGSKTYELSVKDNGIGLPATVDIANCPTLGLSLVWDLSTKQLDGTLTLNQDQGTEFLIRFNDPL